MYPTTTDTSKKTPLVGRRLFRDLDKYKKAVTTETSIPETTKTYTLDEAFDPLWKKLNEHYGVDLRKI